MANMAEQEDELSSNSNAEEDSISESEFDPQPTEKVKRTPSHGGKTRKRKPDPKSWKQSTRKRLRQSGKEYTSSKGKKVGARAVKTTKNCSESCKFKCSNNISDDDRKKIFESFWAMSREEKQHFINTNTERLPKERCRTDKGEHSRKTYSYFYYFILADVRLRVCKEFYLSTLDISSRRVSYFHENKNLETGVPAKSKWGKHAKKKLPSICKQSVRDHINSIPRVQSHYCRQSTQKEYFEGSLNMNKLYELYLSDCESKEITPAKKHTYRDIFNHEFNIEFQKPKKDLCDVCYEFNHLMNPSEELKEKYDKHLESKAETKEERKQDRENDSPRIAVVCIDLENVISLPKSNVGNFYYKRKLSHYNLTGHCSLNKKGYCVLWHEAMAGRSGNDIASAVTCMLERILADVPGIESFVLWFDSCVPQNRNSYMSAALREFLVKHPEVQVIEQKFCEPGHSSIQEVDNIHSQIDRALGPAEIFSPLGLVRTLLGVNRRNPFVVIQMQPQHIKGFSQVAGSLNYKDVPYFSVKSLLYRAQNPDHISYKDSFTGDYKEVRLRKKQKTTRRSAKQNPSPMVYAKILQNDANGVSMAKKKDIESMYRYMPPIDVTFYKTILK